ncbi:MAG: hypothetical protein SFW09_13130 [Hyphomicrobiaceae bacterium]|nr:hypothetical protein [Hyphomicrobiaceae bacterium]
MPQPPLEISDRDSAVALNGAAHGAATGLRLMLPVVTVAGAIAVLALQESAPRRWVPASPELERKTHEILPPHLLHGAWRDMGPYITSGPNPVEPVGPVEPEPDTPAAAGTPAGSPPSPTPAAPTEVTATSPDVVVSDLGATGEASETVGGATASPDTSETPEMTLPPLVLLGAPLLSAAVETSEALLPAWWIDISLDGALALPPDSAPSRNEAAPVRAESERASQPIAEATTTAALPQITPSDVHLQTSREAPADALPNVPEETAPDEAGAISDLPPLPRRKPQWIIDDAKRRAKVAERSQQRQRTTQPAARPQPAAATREANPAPRIVEREFRNLERSSP